VRKSCPGSAAACSRSAATSACSRRVSSRNSRNRVFTRQVFLGETLDTGNIAADYAAGVLTLTIPVREAAKPRNIQITSSDDRQAVTA
jgi:HSP20 family molecular chaperone IbpA